MVIGKNRQGIIIDFSITYIDFIEIIDNSFSYSFSNGNEVEVEFQIIKSWKNVCDDLLLITCRKLDLQSSMAAKDKIRRKKENQVITRFKRLPQKTQFFNVLLG